MSIIRQVIRVHPSPAFHWVECFAGAVVLAWAPAVIHGQSSSTTGAGRDSWPMFRGDTLATGVAETTIPESLILKWTFQVDEPLTATAAIAGGFVYVGDEGGRFHAVDLTTGKEQWKFEVGEDTPIKASALALGGHVYFGDDAGRLFALSASNGEKTWMVPMEGSIAACPTPWKDRIVVGSYDGALYCLRQTTGEIVWKYATEGKIHGTSAVADDIVLVAGCDAFLHVVRADDGQIIRKIKLDAVTGASTAVQGNIALVGTYEGQFHALDWQAGTRLWTFKDPERDLPVMSSASVSREGVYFGCRDKRLRSLNPADGRLQWEFVTKGRIDSSPVRSGDRIFFGNSEGTFYALDRKNGTEAWKYETGAGISASPAAASGRIVIGTEDGSLLCFGPP